MKTWRKENCITSVHKHDPLLADGSKVGRSNGCGEMIIILLSFRIVIGSLGYQHACLFRTHYIIHYAVSTIEKFMGCMEYTRPTSTIETAFLSVLSVLMVKYQHIMKS